MLLGSRSTLQRLRGLQHRRTEKDKNARLRLQSINAKLTERDNKSKVDLKTVQTTFEHQLHEEIRELLKA